MEGSTSIDDLPMAPAGISNSDSPVQLQVSEVNTKVDAKDLQRMEEERRQLSVPQGPADIPMSQEEASQLVQGLQMASRSGALALPSRDIPMDQSQVNMDQEARANFVPVLTTQQDYIGNTQNTDEIIAHSNMKKQKEDTWDKLYDELQAPIIIAVLFFVFKIPNVQSLLFRSFPMLLKTDGNPSLGGYLYLASIFGLSYFILNKTLQHLSQV